MNHKRTGPKSTRAGCLLCKPWKRQKSSRNVNWSTQQRQTFRMRGETERQFDDYDCERMTEEREDAYLLACHEDAIREDSFRPWEEVDRELLRERPSVEQPPSEWNEDWDASGGLMLQERTAAT